MSSEVGRMQGDDGRPHTPFPRLISVETIGTCNARCTFCPHPSLDKNAKRERMSLATFDRIAAECALHPDLEVVTLSFQNEPLTDRRIFKLIGRFRAATGGRVKLAIVTNGSMLTPRRVDELLENPPDLLKISVTGISDADYESLMVGLKFSRTQRYITALMERIRGLPRPDVQINCVYTDEVRRVGVRQVAEFWAERGLRVHVMNLENRNGALQDFRAKLPEQRWNVRTWCKRPEEQLSVWPNGDVALCCADWKKEVILGNVNFTPLQDIWHGHSLNRFRKGLRAGKTALLHPCNTCMAAEIEFEGSQYVEFGKRAEALKEGLHESSAPNPQPL